MNILDNITFKNPHLLYLEIIPVLIILYGFIKQKRHYIRFSSNIFFIDLKKSWRVRFVKFPFILKVLALFLMIICLARPRTYSQSKKIETEGVDIIITLDISSSMRAMDFKPNRFKAATKVAKEFISGRESDRIGLIVFAGEAYTQCPVTGDYKIVIDLLDKVKMDVIKDGTGIGDALMTSIARLKDSKSKNKVIILLTDGENTCGEVDPESAAEIAKTMGVRVYTIGIGKKVAPYPYVDVFGRQGSRNVVCNIDEKMLNEVASVTGGRYFKAEDSGKLSDIYSEIDKLEKTKINTKIYRKYTDEVYTLLLISILTLILGFLLERTIWKINS